jgi:prolyl-tRNA editing enzyme YbaK/EbsC (Cys-tRNA(Pro) deacylase)
VTTRLRAFPEPVERVASFLRVAAVDATIQEFPEGTPTAEEAARAAGCKLEQIVKSLVFVADGEYVLALVPGDRRADERKVAAEVEAREVRVARGREVLDATGFEPGAVAPFPLSRVERIFVEPSLLAHERVWVGAGSDRHMAGLSPAELVRLARAEPRALVRDD